MFTPLFVCLFVCWFVYPQDILKSSGWIWMKHGGVIEYGPRTNRLTFGDCRSKVKVRVVILNFSYNGVKWE